MLKLPPKSEGGGKTTPHKVSKLASHRDVFIDPAFQLALEDTNACDLPNISWELVVVAGSPVHKALLGKF